MYGLTPKIWPTVIWTILYRVITVGTVITVKNPTLQRKYKGLFIFSVVPVRCKVRCTVIRCRTEFIRFRTIYTIKYGTVRKAGNWVLLHQRIILGHIYTKNAVIHTSPLLN